MMHRFRGLKGSTIAVMVAAAMLVASTASAVVIKGRGELRAAGNGLAVVELRGQASIGGAGLVIVDDFAIVETDGIGRETEIGGGRVLFEGFGRVTVRSLDRPTRIEAGGAKVRLAARGVGRAFLKGCGVFHTDDVDGPWAPDNEVEFDSES